MCYSVFKWGTTFKSILVRKTGDVCSVLACSGFLECCAVLLTVSNSLFWPIICSLAYAFSNKVDEHLSSDSSSSSNAAVLSARCS